MGAIDLAAELNRFREHLLDLTAHNPLLNYKKSKRKTLQIIDELPNEIFDRLVSQNKTFRFEPSREIERAIDLQDDEKLGKKLSVTLPSISSDVLEVEKRFTDDKLQTNLSPERLDNVLKGIRREANTAMEEKGINYLYLAIGMLDWTEREDSERELLSPLILIPIHINRFFDSRAGKYDFSVNWTEDEIKNNLCLVKRIERDFGIIIPEYEDELPPEAYFDLVKNVIQSKSHWEIRREALLGFFSFHKLEMYVDIDPEKWITNGTINESSLVSTILCGQDSSPQQSLYASDYHIDNNATAQSIILATDADSSQHSALCDIADGKNLVIEGPPGTGKSQTITNARGCPVCC